MDKAELIRSIGRVLRELDLIKRNPPPDISAHQSLEEIRNTLARQQLELAIIQVELEDEALRRATSTLQAISGDLSLTQTARQTLILNTVPKVVKEVGALLESVSH